MQGITKIKQKLNIKDYPAGHRLLSTIIHPTFPGGLIALCFKDYNSYRYFA
jgi:hypothetical protein